MVDGFLSSSLINRRSECAFSLQIEDPHSRLIRLSKKTTVLSKIRN
ncbi:hypothetical protein AAZX31_19G243600 [Glycine max]